MAEFLLALESEEIPAAMQQPAAEALAQALKGRLSALAPRDLKPFWGPRRIGLAVTINAIVPASTQSERGPRITAPDQALTGFLRKHDAKKSDLQEEKGFWVLNRQIAERSAASFLQEIVPEILWNFTWPKSMRWGNGSAFTWVRPLRRIIAILDGDVVPFTLAHGDDDGHRLASGNLSQGHRFLAPELFAASSFEGYREGLRKRKVILEADARREAIWRGLKEVAASNGVSLEDDDTLLSELAGLAEFPEPLLGEIDAQYMALPAEVRQVSMRTHQRYFATKYDDGRPAPYFLFVANQSFPDGDAATVAGNERVLSARLADARHFWNLDRKVTLASHVQALDLITFHRKLGSLGDRVKRLIEISDFIAGHLCATEEEKRHARRAAFLAKADLTTGMVGEFPELQGIMGGYYAEQDGEVPEVAEAIRSHYKSLSPHGEYKPTKIAMAVALADRFDILAGFFAIDQIPTGSGDPYALRRAAFSIIAIVIHNNLDLDLKRFFKQALTLQPVALNHEAVSERLTAFVIDRARAYLRNESVTNDIIAAVMSTARTNDVRDLKSRAEALRSSLMSGNGPHLIAASKRAANILQIENQKDGPHRGEPEAKLFTDRTEKALSQALQEKAPEIIKLMKDESYEKAMGAAIALREPLNNFLDAVTINDPDPALRINRLRLLNRIDEVLNQIADFSEIQGYAKQAMSSPKEVTDYSPHLSP